MPTHKVTTTWTSGSQQAAVTKDLTASIEQNLDETIADSETNLQVNFTLDVSANALFMIWSDQALTVKSNSATTPDETITLAANVPLVWMTGSHESHPFSGDVTALFVTNASGSAAALKIRSLTDATP